MVFGVIVKILSAALLIAGAVATSVATTYNTFATQESVKSNTGAINRIEEHYREDIKELRTHMDKRFDKIENYLREHE
jgi:hypothetical protein